MPTVKPRTSKAVAIPVAKLRPLLNPIVEPVMERLERNEKVLQQVKAALDLQFKRTAETQAQLDILVARLAKERR